MSMKVDYDMHDSSVAIVLNALHYGGTTSGWVVPGALRIELKGGKPSNTPHFYLLLLW